MNPDTPPAVTVTLSPFQWSMLLTQLENDMCIVNRDRENLFRLYEIIASQLAGHPVTVRRPEAKKPLAETPTREPERRTWLKDLFNWYEGPTS